MDMENFVQNSTVTGGTSPYTYLWSTGATTNSVTIALAGAAVTLSVTVTDANGCTATDVVVITPNENFNNGGTISGTQTNCGAFDPPAFTSVTLPSGGTGAGAAEYLWFYTTTTCSTPPTTSNMYGWVAAHRVQTTDQPMMPV